MLTETELTEMREKLEEEAVRYEKLARSLSGKDGLDQRRKFFALANYFENAAKSILFVETRVVPYNDKVLRFV